MPADSGALWLFAGSNGAGKTTFIDRASAPGGPIEGVSVLNPDRLTKELLQATGYPGYTSVPPEVYREAFVRAAQEMEQQAEEQLRVRGIVCIETVLSTSKYLPLVLLARRLKVPIYFVYVVLRSPALACERVERRVSRGGHPVPRDKIIARYHRSLENLPQFAARATRFWVYDNSDSDPIRPPRLLAFGERRKLVYIDMGGIPQVVRALTGDAGGGTGTSPLL